MKRKITRRISVADVPIGGGSPVVIQSMTNTPAEDVDNTLRQIESLVKAGCRIVRISIPNLRALESFSKIRKQTKIPLVADIHFQYKLAIGAIEAGADKIRINPGNIGSNKNVKKISDAAKHANIPIRIGVNAGSLEKSVLQKHGHPTAEALLESALYNIRLMESFGFADTIISIKASDVPVTIDACSLLADKSDCPQHIGITESGTVHTGTIKSAVGIGAILSRGIGDTIRVSLAGDPVQEIYAAKKILKSLNLAPGPRVIACPTCGRTRIDVAQLAERVEEMVSDIEATITIAVMGCIVNGPGEAKEADIGICGGNGEGKVFVKGQMIENVSEEKLLDTLMRHVQKYVNK